MPESFEEVCANIKACLNSSKNQISIRDLNRDYDTILGVKIPYVALGFRSLEALLKEVPDLKINNIGGEIFVDVKADENTRHITDLVRGQKANKKPNSGRGRYGYRRTPPPRRITPPKSQFKPRNSQYGSFNNVAPKQYNQPSRYPVRNYYDDQRYNTSNVRYNADPRPQLRSQIEAKASAPRPQAPPGPRPSAPKNPDDPRSNAPRYSSESQNKPIKFYQVPPYTSQTNSFSRTQSRDQNQNTHSNHTYEKSRIRDKSPSPKFSPTFSDPEEDPSYVDLTTNGHHVKPKPILQVTSGSSRKVTVGKPNSRSVPNNFTKHNSFDEDIGHSSMSSYSKYSSYEASSDEDYAPRNSAPSFHRNHNPSHGKSSPSEYGEQELVSKFENFKITIKNNGPRDYIKLFYDADRRDKR